ncbi:serine hydrolase [Algoriphagus sp.]|uniref:serine hydrolase domain-containing protein n=1 Tax=Algoriphagus sp. TaxID=1872435 RepID=UPI0025FA1E7C|nr:serine hydrolase domain-containing protein [Algoriphagus sp.]
MNHSFQIPILFLILFCKTFNSNAQEENRTKELIEIMSKNSIPGLSITSIENGEISESLALGVKSQETGEVLGDETVFSAASLSKPVFAYLVMQMVEEEVLDLNQPLVTYFDYPDVNADKRHLKVTAKMILSHTSGLPNWRKKKLKFIYDPGDRYSYSGEGFVWLQKVIEHLKGESLEELAQRYIFTPLKMSRSSYIFLEGFEDDFSVSYKSNGDLNPKAKIQKPNAAASLQTTSTDYAKFLVELLKNKNGNTGYLDQMSMTVAPVEKNQETDYPVFWGLGVGIQKTPDGNQIFQWGDNYTFKGFFTLNIKTGNGVVYFSNSENGLAPLKEIVSIYLKDPQPAADWLNY